MSALSAHYTGYEPIAIVGIGCRVAGAHSPGALWRLLIEGRDQVGEIPSSRWDVDQLYSADPRAPGRMVTRAGSFLERSEQSDRPGEIDGFDWRVFGIPPREAKHVDPQHRILLEVAWEALEDAGWPLESIAGEAGAVHIGIFTRDYEKQLANRHELIEGYTAASNTGAFAANRLSFFFDLRGPSVAVDATSASSAVAIHQACRSIWAGEAEFALTGGVSLILAPDVHISMSKAGALSPSGRCRTLDADADGMVRGEGAGLLVLAPLSRARAR
ncbi:MAG: hypothetical protein Tsb0020_11710 [Haliangiales bacterium]